MEKKDIELLKYMYRRGYTQKQLQLVFKVSKTTIHRVVKEKTWSDVEFKSNVNEENNDSKFWKNKKIMDKVLELNEIPGGGRLQKNDLAYIALLKKCHVSYTRVRSVYSDVSVKILRSAFNYPTVGAEDFDSYLIGIDKEEYSEFLDL